MTKTQNSNRGRAGASVLVIGALAPACAGVTFLPFAGRGVIPAKAGSGFVSDFEFRISPASWARPCAASFRRRGCGRPGFVQGVHDGLGEQGGRQGTGGRDGDPVLLHRVTRVDGAPLKEP